MLIYDALRTDHEKVKELMGELVMLNENDEKRSEIIQQIRDELIPHARAEEAVLYNCLRGIEATRDVVMHGYSEHVEAETLLRTLQVAGKIDAGWRATAQKLKESLEHHIHEEETKIFNVAQQVITQDEAEMMCEAFEQMKPEIREQGFMKNTLDMIVNLMPLRFQSTLRAHQTEYRP